jgi:phosphoglycolate phosphatase-like HAD superfamily hydrolase
MGMTNSAPAPIFFKSYLLGRNVQLDEIKTLSDADLRTLNVETLASLDESRFEYGQIDNKHSADAGPTFARMKIAGYFQAAIKIELASDD